MDETFTPFTPSPAVATEVIDALGSPDNTLRDVAVDFKTTVEALTLWMTRPDIAARLDAIQSAVTRRTRLMATNFLPGVVRLLNSIIDHYSEDEHEREPQPLAPEPRRHRENARKAAALLIRLARLTGTSSPRERPNPSAPPPLGGTALQSGAPPIAPARFTIAATRRIPSTKSRGTGFQPVSFSPFSSRLARQSLRPLPNAFVPSLKRARDQLAPQTRNNDRPTSRFLTNL